ncbi:hypothetical protein [uncultured Gammaproteobacteria bacterium]|nr:hypothetical protein [uncultured Gammaproteobacteria bacterium]CAC9565664.1 hypothetical protein [uncultured Gammaproteobacteria bacterium]CAC9571881.1 hypothetical protein [uncultured Gammaproteobacteria bacterium]CAC9572428.1 hypothetical protein [uncultured Gammaproteobacteria bacterium]CAC9964320.1 hypothetical protein [uncultured Gammaproteobacteria bacterium]
MITLPSQFKRGRCLIILGVLLLSACGDNDDNSSKTIYIEGNVIQNETLSVNISGLKGVSGSNVTYQWYAGDDLIRGQSGGTLLLTQAYVNKKIKARAIFANSSGALEYVYSEPSKLITNVNDIAIISILGNAIQGETLNVNINDLDGVPSGGIIYQWYIGDDLINGQNGNTLLLTQVYMGKQIKVRTTFVDSMGASEDGYSMLTALVSDAMTGYFKGSAVKGLKYTTETFTDVTDELGTYKYQVGEHIKFYLGGLYLGQSLAIDTLYPSDIAASNQDIIKIIQLLQTLDADSDPSNGIDVARFSTNSDKILYLPDGDLSQVFIDIFDERKILVSKEDSEQFLTTEIANDRDTNGYTKIIIGENEYNFTFPSTGIRTFEIPTLACAKVNCCKVKTFESNVSGVKVMKDNAIVDQNRVIRFNMKQQAQNEISIKIQSVGAQACYYKNPIVKEIQTPEQTQKTIQAQGQNGDNYPTLKVLESNQNYYLQTTVPALQGADVKIKTTKSIGLGDGGEHIKHTATKAKYLDKDGIDAHANSTKVYDYLKKTLNMNSYDNQGGDLLTITNYLFPRSNSSCEDCSAGTRFNALYSGGKLYYTPAKPNQGYNQSLSSVVNVAAHEWGHAITGSFSNLKYSREPGAINEAFSDWFGITVEQDYSTGEKSWTLGPKSKPFRSMSNPSSWGVRYGSNDSYKILNENGDAYQPDVDATIRYPDTYKGNNWRTTDVINCLEPSSKNDQCGIHSNSSAANKMFYLLSVGGTHNGITVTGIGVSNAIKITLDANKNYWVRETTFHSAKAGMIASAGDEVINGINVSEQVKLAWEAINVLDSNRPQE